MSSTTVPIPDGIRETMDDQGWGATERDAWATLHDAREGDYVLFADRSIAMEVVDTGTDDGIRYLEVDKPRADGTYRVRESWAEGELRISSPIGAATDLRFVDRAPEPRGLTKAEYDDLVDRQVENAIDAFVRLDYGDWDEAVTDVVEDWAEEVAFQTWSGYKHHPDWEADDAEAIYESIVQHGQYDSHPDDATPRERATTTLFDDVFHGGREQAESTLITSESDYWDIVEMLSHHSVDRYERKSYGNARVAVRDTISNWVEDRGEPAHQSILEYGTARFPDSDYDNLSPEEELQERAWDILDHDVWEEVQSIQRSRGDHDPTLRGLTYTHYQDLVDYLVQESLKAHGSNDALLRTTVKKTIREWADEVEAESWGGHRHRVYAEGDVEDIFSSVAIHADNDPSVFNPFSRHKERKLAISALMPDVHKRTSNALDEREEQGEMYEIDEFIDRELGMSDVSYSDIQSAQEGELRDFLERAIDSAQGDEVGWTFVEEIIRIEGTVPEATNDWVLIDYGVVREGDTHRRLAWFDQETGDVLVLSGIVEETLEDMIEGNFEGDPYGPFHVQRVDFSTADPHGLVTDVTLSDALDYVYDYIDADHSDLRIIETEDGIYVEDRISDDDINVHGALDALVPNLYLSQDDVAEMTWAGARGVGSFLRRYWTEITGLAALAALYQGHKYAGAALLATNLRPNIHRSKGVGVKGSREIGAGKYERGVGGTVDTELYVRPQTFGKLAQDRAPNFIKHGFREGDLGKGAAESVGQALEGFRAPQYVFTDEAVEEILEYGNDQWFGNRGNDPVPEETVRELARQADRDFESEDVWDDIEDLRPVMWGYAEHYEPEEVSWGEAFLDTYGGSAERLESILRRGAEDALEETAEMDREAVDLSADVIRRETQDAVEDSMGATHMGDIIQGDLPDGILGGDPELTPSDIAEMDDDEFREFADSRDIDPDEFSWDDLSKTNVGISGLFLRGLEAEDVVAAADWLNVEGWLDEVARNTVDRAATTIGEEAPSFSEWEQERYGPGVDGGPAEESRRMARYHREVAAGAASPDPYDALGVNEADRERIERQPDEMDPDDLGDYHLAEDKSYVESAFDAVADRFTRGETNQD